MSETQPNSDQSVNLEGIDLGSDERDEKDRIESLVKSLPGGEEAREIIKMLPKPAGPGRQYAQGRRADINALDAFLARERNIHRLLTAFEAEMNADPLKFMERIVMPMTPTSLKESTGTVDAAEDKAIALQKALRAMNEATASLSTAVEAGLPAKGD